MRLQNGLGTLPSVFQPLADADRASLRSAGALAMLAKGERLIRSGQKMDRVPFVISGWVALELHGISVALLRPGDSYLQPLDASEPAAALELRAMSGATVALIERRTLRAVLARYPALLVEFIEQSAAQMNLLLVAQGKQANEPLEVRLAWLLWTLARAESDGTRRIPDSVPQAVLAGMLGASREEINRKRRLLMRAGFLLPDDEGTRIDSSTALLLGAHDYPV